jgi:hypothetical protein
MKKRLSSYLLIGILLALILTPLSIALAIQSPVPANIISEVQVTPDNYETGDQLYIVPFTIGSCNTTDYTATDLFIIRLLDSGVEIATATPYSFRNNGFSSGCTGFYFKAADSDIPTWGSSNLTIEIIGNPSISWDEDIPYVSSNSFNWAVSKSYVAIKIRTLAQLLENDWSVDLIEPIQDINQLTSYGEAYFDSVIPNLRIIAPTLYVSGTDMPVYSATDNNTDYQTQLQEEAVASITGASGNVTVTAGVIGGISANTFLTLVWTIGGLIFIGAIGWGTAKMNPEGAAVTQMIVIRSSLAIFSLWMVFGTVYKYVILQVGIGIAAIAFLGIVFTFFFRGSSY